MANVKITDLTAYTDPASTDVIPIVDLVNDQTKKVALSNIFQNFPDGTAAAPSIAFDGDSNTGIYRPSADQLAISTSGTQRLVVDSTGQIEAKSLGSASAPTWSFVDDPNTGIYSPGADQLAISTGGTARLTVSTSAVTSALPVDVLLGSASTPSFTFTGDLNTGIYSPGADQVAISTNGTEKLRILSGGELDVPAGIGPQIRFENQHSVTTDAAISTFDDANGTLLCVGSNFYFNSSGSETRYNTGEESAAIVLNRNGTIDLNTGDTTLTATSRLRITSDGKVGVGTSSPSYKLDVSGTARTTGILFNSDDSILGTQGTISRHSVVGLTQKGITGSVFDWSVYSTAGTAVLQNPTGTNKMAFSGGEVYFTGGNVGVGTTSPSEKLEILDGHISVGSSTNTNSTNVLIDGYGYILSGTKYGKTSIRSTYSNATNAAGLEFYVASSSTATDERMRIDSSGNVGVGTSDPSGRLEVSGGYLTVRSGASSFPDGVSAPIIYGSIGGGSGTFDQTGNLVLQTRSDAGNYSICMVTGDTPTERMRIDSSGRLGVGTTDPGTLLQVADAADSGVVRIGGNNAGTTGLDITYSNSGTTTTTLKQNYRSSNANALIDIDTGILTFSTGTSGSERVRIDSSGRLLVGTTSAVGTKATISQSAAAGPILTVGTVNNTGSCIRTFVDYTDPRTHIDFYVGATVQGSITGSSSSVSYNTSSDYRLKDNIVPITDGITRVKQLAPKRFNFIVDADTTVDGFLAHEAQTVVPEAVTGTHNEVDDDGKAVMQGIDQSKLVPLLTAALQEAIAKIETLEQRLSDAGIA